MHKQGSLTRRLGRAIALSLAIWFFTACVAPAPAFAQPVAASRAAAVNGRVVDRLFRGFDRVLRGTAKRLDGRPGWSATVISSFVDNEGRAFCHLQGSFPLSVPHCPVRLEKKIDGLAGYRLSTNGSVAVDLVFHEVEKTGRSRWTISFDLSVVVLVRNFLKDLAKTAGAFLATTALGLVADKLSSFFDNIDVDLLGEGVEKGVKGSASLVSGRLTGETYTALARFRGESFARDLGKHLRHRSFLFALGGGIVACGLNSGIAVAATSLGAAMGTILAPGLGASVVAALGAAAVTYLGGVVVTFVTKKLPFRITMGRLRRYHEQGKVEKKGKVEERFLSAIQREIDTDRYERFDRLAGYLKKARTSGEDIAPFESLVKSILDLLRFRVVNDRNWNGARKYYQFLDAIDRLPDTRCTETGSTR